MTPHSTSVGFHEGHPGLDFVEFLESNPPPAFTGAVGQTNAQFNAAITLWNAAWATLNTDANRLTTRRTECVGTSKDQFNRAGRQSYIHISVRPMMKIRSKINRVR